MITKEAIEAKQREFTQQERQLSLEIHEAEERLERLRADRAAFRGAMQACALFLQSCEPASTGSQQG